MPGFTKDYYQSFGHSDLAQFCANKDQEIQALQDSIPGLVRTSRLDDLRGLCLIKRLIYKWIFNIC